jgi:hypothetical protein
MHTMGRLRAKNRARNYDRAALLLAMVLGLAQGCSRSQPISPGDAPGSSATQEHLPFHSDTTQPAGAEIGQVAADPKSAGSVPFRAGMRPQTLPVGTLLTVELDHSLSALSVHPGDAFAASLAAPLIVDGNTIVERGAEVTGRVEGAESRHGSGYVELSLGAIRVEGTVLTLQTSSLFARGSEGRRQLAADGKTANPDSGMKIPGVKIPKGRRLTFRLSAPVNLERREATGETRNELLKPDLGT